MMFRFIFLLLSCLFLVSPVWAGDEDTADEKDAQVSISLPRFGVLRFNEVNVRTGPGTRYPIDWVYRQVGMPVEVVAKFEYWYRIKDYEGTLGWVHKSKLRWHRRGMVMGNKQDVRREPDAQAAITAHLMPRVAFDVESCDTRWCRIKGKDFEGYLRQNAFFGVYAQEKF